MKKLLAIMALSVGLLANAQTVDLLKPAKDIVLRAPSVPIIVSDPYFSIWSPYDKLMEGSTEHWTSAKKPLLGALRVDGKVYRFLGAYVRCMKNSQRGFFERYYFLFKETPI